MNNPALLLAREALIDSFLNVFPELRPMHYDLSLGPSIRVDHVRDSKSLVGTKLVREFGHRGTPGR